MKHTLLTDAHYGFRRHCMGVLPALALCGLGGAYADEQKVANSPQDQLEYQILEESDQGFHPINRGAAWKDASETVPGLPETAGSPDGSAREALFGSVILTAPQKPFIALRTKSASSDGVPEPKAAATPSAKPPVTPNFVFILTDDQRWDATGFMQGRMASLGRTARFPYLVDRTDGNKPVSMTPNMDRLSTEGIHFDNGFCVYALCSPSRSAMLTGIYPHLNGVTANDQDFPVNATTYATLLRDAGWATGYFGKWHHGEQAERPGFDSQQSFRGQGKYYGTTFYDEKGTARTSKKWVDEQTTDYAIDFINTQQSAGKPFLAFVGLKTPHGPRQDKTGKSNAPEGFKTLFNGADPAPVPSLLSQGAPPPPWKPEAKTKGLGKDPRNYMRLISAADAQVGRVLDRLTELGIAENTVVIFVSDNGYFIGEHGLGDKRAGFEESLRIPFMIRYPALQAGGSGRIAKEMVLNVDLTPTILDLAGLPIPGQMQGRSLRPLIENKAPDDWRDSFFFSYTDDPAYPGSVADFIGVRFNDGRKLLRYALDPAWDEFYRTSPTGQGSDQFELKNLISAPSESADVATMQARLERSAGELGFLEQIGLRDGDPAAMEIRVGATYPFRLQSSADFKNWTTSSTFEGSGGELAIDLVTPPTGWDITVEGNPADYTTIAGSPVSVAKGTPRLSCGAKGGVGRNAVLVFALPPLPPGKHLSVAQLEVTAKKTYAKWWEADLWAIGIKGNAKPIREYHGTPSDPAPVGVRKLQDALFDVSLPAQPTVVRSSLASGLSAYLRDFYRMNPGYAGGKNVFLRISPEKRDMSTEGNERFEVMAAESPESADRPKLHLSFQSQSPTTTRYWRVGYGSE